MRWFTDGSLSQDILDVVDCRNKMEAIHALAEVIEYLAKAEGE